MAHKILCTIGEAFSARGKEILATLGEARYVAPSQRELPSLVSDATILVIQLGLAIDRAAIEAAPRLRYIATATTGLDHIDTAYAEEKGVEIVSLKGETAFLSTVTATAELACGLMIALVRKIPAAHASVASGRWDRAAFAGRSLQGKTLGIVGYGRLGKMLARYGEAFGMRVVYADSNVAGGIDLEELLGSADVVSLHMPLSPETEGVIDESRLRLLKPAAVLINTSRGKIVDEAAVIDALEMKRLAGYAADVLADELSFAPENAKSPLIDYARAHDNVILTPHIGGTTIEAREATDTFIAEKLRRVVSSRTTHL